MSYSQYSRILLILLALVMFFSFALAEGFSWTVAGKGYESLQGTNVSCTRLVSEACVWNCDDECAACIASGECNRTDRGGSCGTLGTKEECRCYLDYTSTCVLADPRCEDCTDVATATNQCVAQVERSATDGPNPATIAGTQIDLGTFSATPLAQQGGTISNITYTVFDSSDTVSTYLSDTLTNTSTNPNARVYAEPLAGSSPNTCPKLWTTQSDFAYEIKTNIDTETSPGDMKLSKASKNGLWHFDEGTGTTAYDSGNTGVNGTLFNNPAWVTGKCRNSGIGNTAIETSFYYGGVGGNYAGRYVNFGSFSVHPSASDNFSVDVWAYATELPSSYPWETSTYGAIVSRMHFNAEREGDWALYIDGANGNKPTFRVKNSTNTAWHIIAGNSGIQTNTWYHLKAEWNNSNMYLYQDDALVASATGTDFGSDASNWHSIYVGHIPWQRPVGDQGQTHYAFFNGRIDELQINGKGAYNSPGAWSAVLDSGNPQTDFTQLNWAANNPAGTNTKFRIKTASTENELS